MKRVSSISIAILASLLISAFIFTRPARAQEGRERGLKSVGATRSEINSGAAKNVQLWAVLIGVSRYKFGDQNLGGYQIANLKNAADDAQALYEFLRSPEGGAFPDDHIILLKDEKATKAEVEGALVRLRQSKPDDFFVISIAAHGILAPQYDKQQGRTIEIPYFALFDSNLKDMESTGLRMEAFDKAVRSIPAKKGLVLSDTCHSAGVVMAGRGGEAETRANSLLTEQLKKIDAAGVGYIWAADQTEVSFEKDDLSQGQGQGQGVFTYCLLEGLRGNADGDADGVVSFLELKNYVRDKVPDLTENRQHPGGNTTSIETNDIPLAIVPGTCKDARGCGSLVIRAPDMDGVEVAIDDTPSGTINSRTEITRRAPAGPRRLLFTKGSLKRQRQAVIEPGRTKFIEVNLSFSQSDEEALVATPDTQVNVFFSEEKEPLKDARESFLDGVDMFNRQKMDAAVEKLNEAIKKNGGAYADALVYRGRAEQSLGRRAEAVASFQQAVAMRKSDFETEALLAEARFNLNHDPSEVEQTLRGIIKRHPNFDFARVVLADVLFFRKDYIGAERELKHAVRINPKSPPPHLILADVLTHQDSKEKQAQAVKEAREALRLFEEVSKKQVSAARALKGLSLSHLIFGGGRFRNDAAMAEAHHMVAKAITRMVYFDDSAANAERELETARASLNTAKELAKADKTRMALVLETSALNYLLKGDMTRAIEDGEAVLKLKELPEAHFYLSQAYSSNQKFAPAVEHMQKYIAIARPQLSSEDLKKYEEELAHLTKMRDANRQKK